MVCRFLVFVFCFTLFSNAKGQETKLFHVPARNIQPYKLGGVDGNVEISMEGFDISSFVTYGEYKKYLKEIKKDSSNSFYSSQLPDSSMCLPSVYSKYVNSAEYDDYPVLGIRWDAAMDYCRWMTIRNNNDTIKDIYYLPTYLQWIDAYDYFNGSEILTDLNKDYSDWLLNSKDESFYNRLDTTYAFNYMYLANGKEPRVLKRKFVIGDSYFFKQAILLNYYRYTYYSDCGYRQIGFRYVKYSIKGKQVSTIPEFNLLKYWRLDKRAI